MAAWDLCAVRSQCSIAGALYGTGYTEAYIAAAKREGRVLENADAVDVTEDNDVSGAARPSFLRDRGPE